MAYCIEMTTKNPFARGFAYIDLATHQADKLLEDHGAKVRFDEEYSCKGTPYNLVTCTAKGRKNIQRVRDALAELPGRMRALGHPNYVEECDKMAIWGAAEAEEES